jgi:nucleotide-binding universal stress UspA family protein
MGSEIHINLLGGLFAFIFTASMVILLWWMFNVPRPIPMEVARARRTVGAIKKILVPTSGTFYSERAIEMACRLGGEQNAEIYLVTIIEVPRTLPLEAPIPEAEEKAKEIIKRGEEIVNLRGLKAIGEVKRGRVAGEEILRVVEEKDIDLIVMGIQPRIKMAQDILGRDSNLIMHRAPCEVILDKLSE